MSLEEIRRQALAFIGTSSRPYRSGDLIQVAETVPLSTFTSSYDIPVQTYRTAAYILTEADINSVYGRTISFNNWQPTTPDPFNFNITAQPEVKVIPKVGRYKQFKLTKDGMSHGK